jgi:hypothetical protein
MTGKASNGRIYALVAAIGSASLLLTAARPAHADDVPATGKGITGGALLGGEVVVIGEAAFGVKSGWAYLLGGVVGAGGGAYLGYLAEKNGDPKVSLYMLAGGMALVIPATVAALQATSYTPPEDYTEDRPLPPGTPVPEPVQPRAAPPPTPAAPGASTAVPRMLSLHYHWSQPRLHITPGLVGATDDGLRLSVPAVELRPIFSADELVKYGVVQRQELRVALFSATF